MRAPEFCIGLMSGTSLDGVDGVLARWSGDRDDAFETRSFTHRAFAPALHDELLALNRAGADEIHRAALAANALARDCAAAVSDLLEQAGVAAADVAAIGAHGQTVRHRPGAFDGTGYTVQILDGALLAELTHIDVVCDLRARDVAAGGQGAPLVPAFHAACLADRETDVAVLNIGGIANLTLLPAGGGPVGGFDCGPGNLLLDLWCRRHLGRPYDADGAWAAGGAIDHAMLQRWLAEPYFARLPPKSTGRDLFDASWLDAGLAGTTRRPQDVMATLAELTVRGAIEALARHAPRTTRLWVCGGGAFNAHLMRRLAALAGPGVVVRTTAAAGLPPERVEALAFAWLARRFLQRRPGNLPAVTGARGVRLLGALYPA
ncbi:MAG: anhydro-N-acetylmuramic acid kinase [Rubrivivax sp.]|nr:anhydro-N-acetylmuramic acid kinase [Rubrivivax sp.]